MGRLLQEEVGLFNCDACQAEEYRDESMAEVFRIDGQYVLVEGVPCMVCLRCGEQSFSRETAEKVRLLVHGQTEATSLVPMRVYEFAD